jgi:hypothetical protein
MGGFTIGSISHWKRVVGDRGCFGIQVVEEQWCLMVSAILLTKTIKAPNIEALPAFDFRFSAGVIHLQENSRLTYDVQFPTLQAEAFGLCFEGGIALWRLLGNISLGGSIDASPRLGTLSEAIAAAQKSHSRGCENADC